MSNELNETLFDQMEMIEQVPTSLMTEITPQAEKAPLSSITDHTKVDTSEMIIDSAIKENPPITPKNPVQGQQMNAGSLITGDMAVGFLDMILPVACVLLIERFTDRKINKKWLQATPDEKATISPVLQNYLNSINFNVDSPLNALLITITFIYGTKTIEVLNMPQGAQPVKMPSPFPPQQKNYGYNKDGTIKKDGRGRKRKS